MRRPVVVIALLVALAAAALSLLKLTSAPSAAATNPTTVGIYTGQEKPTIPAERDRRSVELGVRFHVSAPGQVTAIRYYKTQANTGAHTGTLWNESGHALATVNFSDESANGFQVAKLATPVTLTPYHDYVVSYHAPNGEYAEQQHTFDGGATIGNSTIRGTSGVYAYGRDTRFPARTWHASSYYVDVLFAPSGSAVSSPAGSSTAAPSTSTHTSSSVSTSSAPRSTSAAPSSSAPASSASTSKPAPSSSTPTSSAPSGSSSGAGVPAGTSLTAVPAQATSGAGWTWTGSALKITGPNVTLNGLDINGAVQGSYDNVTISNSKIRCTNESQWCVSLGNHNKLQNDEIGGGANGTTFGSAIGLWSGGSNAGNVISGVDIHNTSDGMRIDGGTTITGTYVHNLIMGDPADPSAHSDGIQSTGGANVTVSNSRFETGNNCNIFLQWLSGNPAISNYTITGNSFTAGNRNGQQTSYGVCAYSPDVSGVTISNNTFSYGYQVSPLTAPSGSNVSGNVYTDGKPVS
ncbi:MAG TPA: DUF4082 domain-containing protein [Jatrophihabitans sp.]|nr:DUF4082 domain-containing protein [Jatrophihabitans sp.]